MLVTVIFISEFSNYVSSPSEDASSEFSWCCLDAFVCIWTLGWGWRAVLRVGDLWHFWSFSISSKATRLLTFHLVNELEVKSYMKSDAPWEILFLNHWFCPKTNPASRRLVFIRCVRFLKMPTKIIEGVKLGSYLRTPTWPVSPPFTSFHHLEGSGTWCWLGDSSSKLLSYPPYLPHEVNIYWIIRCRGIGNTFFSYTKLDQCAVTILSILNFLWKLFNRLLIFFVCIYCHPLPCSLASSFQFFLYLLTV